MTIPPRQRYYVQSGLAFVVALLGGLFAVLLYPQFSESWMFMASYLALSAALTSAYLFALRWLYNFNAPARIVWFVLRGTVFDPLASLFVLAFILAIMFFGKSGDSVDGSYIFALYILLWFLDLVLVGRHFSDLRPFVRGQSASVPWPHHDGGQNCPEALLFHPPPDYIGEVISAGSLLRAGEDFPPLRGRLLLALWTAGLSCLLCVAILVSSGEASFSQLPFVLPLYAIIGALASVFMLYRKRICSYVGNLGAVQYRIDVEGDVDEWSVIFSDFQRLRTSGSHEFHNGQYLHTSETRCFETSDGGKKEYYFHWNSPEITRASPDLIPDVQAMFWQKIESIWANRETDAGYSLP